MDTIKRRIERLEEQARASDLVSLTDEELMQRAHELAERLASTPDETRESLRTMNPLVREKLRNQVAESLPEHGELLGLIDAAMGRPNEGIVTFTTTEGERN